MNFFGYMKNVFTVVATDEAETTPDMVEHDKRYHGGHAPEGTCRYRDGKNGVEAVNPIIDAHESSNQPPPKNESYSNEVVGNEQVIRFNPIVEHADDQTMKEFDDSVDLKLLDAYRKCKEHGARKHFGELVREKVSEPLRIAIRHILGIDAEGYSIQIDADHLRHIDVDHGKNGRADTSMSNDEDVARMGYVLDNPDQVSLGLKPDGTPRFSIFNNADGSKAKTLLIRKRVNGNFYVSEAVIDSKKKQIRVTGAYKNNGRDPQELMAENSAPIIRLYPTLPKSATTTDSIAHETAGQQVVHCQKIKASEKKLPTGVADKLKNYLERKPEHPTSVTEDGLSMVCRDDIGRVIGTAVSFGGRTVFRDKYGRQVASAENFS